MALNVMPYEKLCVKGRVIMNASIFNEVLGPIMIGPSSSHTAGPARIGKVGYQLLMEPVKDIVITFDVNGSFAAVYNSQGSDFGFVGGLLGIDTSDDRMRNSLEIAAEKNIGVSFEKKNLKQVFHPNQAEIVLTGENGRRVEYTAISTGGGMFEVLRYQGFNVSLKGDSYDIFVTVSNDKGIEELKKELGEIQYFELTESERETDDMILLQLKFDRQPSEKIEQRIKKYAFVKETVVLQPILPVVKRRDAVLPFKTAEEALAYAKEHNSSVWELACAYEEAISGKSREEIFALMDTIIDIMRDSSVRGVEGNYEKRGFLPPQTCKVAKNMEKPGARVFDMGLLNKASLWASATMEYDICMGRCVAAPTGGSCGVLPASIISIGEDMGLSREKIRQGMLVAGLIGVFIDNGATFAAELCGCQAENGSASAMAAAGLAQLLDGTPEEAFASASLALENILGLICDPVAGVGNIPCVSRNSMATVNAVLSANMVLNGFDPYIPLDEAIFAMDSVGKLMAEEHRCTGRGGLCITKAGKKADEYWQSCCAKNNINKFIV